MKRFLLLWLLVITAILSSCDKKGEPDTHPNPQPTTKTNPTDPVIPRKSETLELEVSTVELEIEKTKDINVTKGKALRIENDREDIVVATIKDAGKKISLEAKLEGKANIKIYNKEDYYIILEIIVNKASDKVEDSVADPNIPWESFLDSDYELSNDSLTLLKWKNKNTQYLDMNRDPKLKKVTSIGEKAFFECKKLRSINITSSVTKIKDDAFSKCNSLTSINIPNSVKSIGMTVFSECTSLTRINIPSSVKSIGEGAFQLCKKLNNINIPNSITTIRYGIFYECTSLTSVNIPNSVKEIGWVAFSGCINLKDIKIPESVTSIGDEAFERCINLKNINIPKSVTSIGEYAFAGCTSLRSIDIPNSVTSIGSGAFSNCTSLRSIDIPNSVKSIETKAFSGCKSLTNINIPSSVTSIGEYAFSGCTSLRNIDIPNSITSIDSYAFNGCINLNSIILGSPKILEYSWFLLDNTPNLKYIYVPINLVEKYKNAEGWIDFAAKIKAIAD